MNKKVNRVVSCTTPQTFITINTGGPRLTQNQTESGREATIPNPQGLHARPVMKFVDVASKFQSNIKVRNVSLNGQFVDGKSAMQMMLLEATQGCVIRIEAIGSDADLATEALCALVEKGLDATEEQNN